MSASKTKRPARSTPTKRTTKAGTLAQRRAVLTQRAYAVGRKLAHVVNEQAKDEAAKRAAYGVIDEVIANAKAGKRVTMRTYSARFRRALAGELQR